VTSPKQSPPSGHVIHLHAADGHGDTVTIESDAERGSGVGQQVRHPNLGDCRRRRNGGMQSDIFGDRS
jgi:hypothetical protein